MARTMCEEGETASERYIPSMLTENGSEWMCNAIADAARINALRFISVEGVKILAVRFYDLQSMLE